VAERHTNCPYVRISSAELRFIAKSKDRCAPCIRSVANFAGAGMQFEGDEGRYQAVRKGIERLAVSGISRSSNFEGVLAARRQTEAQKQSMKLSIARLMKVFTFNKRSEERKGECRFPEDRLAILLENRSGAIAREPTEVIV
jgi:hypothetical protein